MATAILLLRPSIAAAGPVRAAAPPAMGDVARAIDTLTRGAGLPVTFAAPGVDLQIDAAFAVAAADPAGFAPEGPVKISRVSEPRTLSIFLVGLAGLLLVRFRRGQRPCATVAGLRQTRA